MSQLLHLCLLDVKRLKPKHEGICTSVFQVASWRMEISGKKPDEARAAIRELADLMMKWPKAEEGVYPVEGRSYDFYKDKAAGTLWDNPRRIELLDWLIERTKNHEIDSRTDGSSQGTPA